MWVELLLIDLDRVDKVPVNHFRPSNDVIRRQGYRLTLKKAIPLEVIVLVLLWLLHLGFPRILSLGIVGMWQLHRPTIT
jgi:hypothetical protein